MYHILGFSRLRSTRVEQINDLLIRATCHLCDTLQEAVVDMDVELPDLNIIKAAGKRRNGDNEWHRAPDDIFQGVMGVRIGPGIMKIIDDLAGKNREFQELVFMLEECCHGVILSFTKKDLLNSPSPDDEEEAIEYYANMVRENVRLYNRCAAFSPDSRIIEHVKTHNIPGDKPRC